MRLRSCRLSWTLANALSRTEIFKFTISRYANGQDEGNSHCKTIPRVWTGIGEMLQISLAFRQPTRLRWQTAATVGATRTGQCRTDAHRHTVEKKLQGQDCNPSMAYDMVV